MRPGQGLPLSPVGDPLSSPSLLIGCFGARYSHRHWVKLDVSQVFIVRMLYLVRGSLSSVPCTFSVGMASRAIPGRRYNKGGAMF